MKTPNIKIIIGIALVISVAGNLYWFGSRWFQERQLQALNDGATRMIDIIYQRAIQNGEVIITNSDGIPIKLIIEHERRTSTTTER